MKACNRKILELFYNAKHTGRVSKPDAIGRVGEDDEGLVIELTWRVIGGIIVEAKFRAFANPNAIAITSLMVDNMIGKSVEEALSLGEEVIIDNLGEFLPEYLEVYDMVRECIDEAYDNYLKRKNRKDDMLEDFDYEQYRATHNIEEGQEIDIKQIQRELYGEVKVERRGRPRKEIDPNAVVEVGEKRGRGRPRKEVDPNAVVEIGEKRGRGRPRKIVEETEITVELGEKRGRGRPRKEIDPNTIVEVGEKRGRGRPRKEVDPNAVVEIGEKRGRGRPRKIVEETEITVELGEKRGRGRPRKEIDPNTVVEVGEKRGRGRPRKEVKFNLPSDLDEVIEDEELDSLINGSSVKTIKTEQVVEDKQEVKENLKVDTTEVVENEQATDDLFEGDYDLFKSNIRNILTGKEVSNKSYTHTSGLSEGTKVVETETDTNQTAKQTIIDVEKANDNVEVKRGRGRPRLQPINSLTRSLTPNGMLPHSNQDIVFASKNVTTTNININVTKTSTSVEDNVATSNDYSHNTTISQQKVEISIPKVEDKNDEIEIEPNKLSPTNTFKDFDDDDDDEIDVSNIKDEAPTGGIEDLLKALLDD